MLRKGVSDCRYMILLEEGLFYNGLSSKTYHKLVFGQFVPVERTFADRVRVASDTWREFKTCSGAFNMCQKIHAETRFTGARIVRLEVFGGIGELSTED